MATNVYLGYPPSNIRAWIENKYKKTIITFDNGNIEEYEWTGEVNTQTLIVANILDRNEFTWLKNPVSIQFGTTVTSIGSNAFTYCSNLTSVSMPNVQTVDGNAFQGCTSLTSVSMPNVQTVGGNAFAECKFTSISMPNVTEIGYGAFSGCYSLTSVSMPNVQTVGGNAFIWCSNLASVSMPNVTSIGSNAFDQCNRLASVSMPNVTTVGTSAFQGCSNLASVSMPSSAAVNIYVFYTISTPAEFENQTTETIKGWFESFVFGGGLDWSSVTITCSNGIVEAEWDDSKEVWTITITPAQ